MAWAFVGLAVSAGLIFAVWSRSRLQETTLEIEVGGARLAGTLYSSASSKNPVPVVVVLHGSGPDGRSNDYYRHLAKTFSQVGFATFVYDKRGSGMSGGNLMAVPFQTIIDDAVAVVRAVRAMPETDDKHFVIWGGSEGGSIAPEVAVRTSAFAVITQSASGVPFWKQNRHQNLIALQQDGLTPGQIEVELQAHEAAMQFARTGQGWSKFEQYRSRGITLPIRGDRNDPWWTWYGTKLDYEPTKWLKKLNVPILAMWGRQDVLVPVDESRDRFKQSLEQNRKATLLVLNPADHGMSNRGVLVHLGQMKDWLTRLER